MFLIDLVPMSYDDAVKRYGKGTIICSREQWESNSIYANTYWLIQRLWEQNKALKEAISRLNKAQQYNTRIAKFEQDYLPYEESDRD